MPGKEAAASMLGVGMRDAWAADTPAASVAPRITAIVCTHNRYETLPDTLASLARQTLPLEAFEVLVIDNSADLVAKQRFWRLFKPARNVRVIHEAMAGLSRARNIGFRTAATPLVAFIDDDAVASEGWLQTLAEAFDADPQAGSAGGPVSPMWAYPAAEPPWLHQYQRGFLTIVDRGAGRRTLASDEWLAGTNIAFRTALLTQAGGFNESLGRIGNALLSNEELEVSRKIHAGGYHAVYDEAAGVLHRVHANRVSQSWMRRRVSWQAVSEQLTTGRAPDTEACWAHIHDYLKTLPAEMRGIRALLLDTPDPDSFYRQCTAIDALLQLLMADGRDPDPATAPVSPARG